MPRTVEKRKMNVSWDFDNSSHYEIPWAKNEQWTINENVRRLKRAKVIMVASTQFSR